MIRAGDKCISFMLRDGTDITVELSDFWRGDAGVVFFLFPKVGHVHVIPACFAGCLIHVLALLTPRRTPPGKTSR
jgi:hypothetical protein